LLGVVIQDDPPTYWPERSYKWGTAEAFNPDHSDLLFLRCAQQQLVPLLCPSKAHRHPKADTAHTKSG